MTRRVQGDLGISPVVRIMILEKASPIMIPTGFNPFGTGKRGLDEALPRRCLSLPILHDPKIPRSLRDSTLLERAPSGPILYDLMAGFVHKIVQSCGFDRTITRIQQKSLKYGKIFSEISYYSLSLSKYLANTSSYTKTKISSHENEKEKTFTIWC